MIKRLCGEWLRNPDPKPQPVCGTRAQEDRAATSKVRDGPDPRLGRKPAGSEAQQEAVSPGASHSRCREACSPLSPPHRPLSQPALCLPVSILFSSISSSSFPSHILVSIAPFPNSHFSHLSSYCPSTPPSTRESPFSAHFGAPPHGEASSDTGQGRVTPPPVPLPPTVQVE